MIHPNAIERTIVGDRYIQQYGEKLDYKRKQFLENHPLDEEKDAPIPEWALEIMRDTSFGYRTRIKIIMTHQFDITNVNPSWRWVQPSEQKSAPLKEAPKAIKEVRMNNKLKAIEYLHSIKMKGNEQ